MTAEAVAKALGGRKAGAVWMACCPAHDDRAPSLAIADAKNGTVLVRCHAGCEQRDVILALRARGAWQNFGRGDRYPFWDKAGRQPTARDAEALKRTEAALAIWRSSRQAKGTLVETYLRSRGLTAQVPRSLRFHAGLWHPSGDFWPCMVALVTRGTDGKPNGIHRTFLARDGAGKAPIAPQKMMLGPCRGGAVRLGIAADALLVGEGIETVLAAMEGTGMPGCAALSTSGLRTLRFPAEVRDIIIVADGDDAGEAAAHHAAERWANQGRQVRTVRPPRGMDFNDLLRAGS